MELEPILLSERLVSVFKEGARLGILDIVLPELARTRGYDQDTPHHSFDLFTHSLRTAAGTPPNLVLRLAGLLHDLGKVETRDRRRGRAVYYGHEEASELIASRVLERLRFPRRTVRAVLFLVRNHMVNYRTEWSDRAVRRFLKKAGEDRHRLLALVKADRKAQGPGGAGRGLIRDLERRLDKAEAHRVPEESTLDGREIMDILGIGEGPLVGEAKSLLEEAVLWRGAPLERPQAEELLRRWAERRLGGGVIAGVSPKSDL
jgi:tRNA nucleotidyltransferase/poly(A) polymerase